MADGQKITFGKMREAGAIDVVIFCGDNTCGQTAITRQLNWLVEGGGPGQ